MKKSKIVCIREFNIIKFFKNNKITVLITFLLILGIIIGTILFKNNTISQKLSLWLFNNYFAVKNAGAFSMIFKSFLSMLAIITVFFICGTSMMGIVTVPICVCTLGLFIGNLTGYIYSEFSIMGIAYTAVIFVPSIIIFIMALISTCKHTMSFSYTITKLTFVSSAGKNISQDFKIYCGKYLIFIFFALLSSIIEMVFNKTFLKFFNF